MAFLFIGCKKLYSVWCTQSIYLHYNGAWKTLCADDFPDTLWGNCNYAADVTLPCYRIDLLSDGSTGIGGNQENAATAEASFQNAEPQFTNTFGSDPMKYLCISSFKMIINLIKSGYGISFVYEVLAKSAPELGIFTLKGESIVREFNVIYLKHADVREKMEWFLWPRLSHSAELS